MGTGSLPGVGAGACAMSVHLLEERGRGQEAACRKRVIPSRRHRAYISFGGLSPHSPLGNHDAKADKSLQSEGVQALCGRDPFLGPAARDAIQALLQCQRHQPLPQGAPTSLCLHTDLAHWESMWQLLLLTVEASSLNHPSASLVTIAGLMGLQSVTTGLSITRLVTVNTPSMMHVSVQAPPLPTQIQAGFDPCHVLQVEGCSSQHAACHGNPLTPGLSAFLFLFIPPSWAYPVFLSSRVDGTETEHFIQSNVSCPSPLFPSRAHTYTSVL